MEVKFIFDAKYFCNVLIQEGFKKFQKMGIMKNTEPWKSRWQLESVQMESGSPESYLMVPCDALLALGH